MKKLLILMLFLFAIKANLEASHVSSADLTYECLGGLNYKISLKIYRDCGGQPVALYQTVNYASPSCSYSGSYNMSLDTSYEISQVCDSLIPFTTCNIGPTGLPGIEVYIFTMNVTLPGYCSDYYFSSTICCRSNSIGNLNTGYNYHTATTLNNLGGVCNDSPTFSSVPVLYTCLNEKVDFNNLAFDPEGDSLSYELVRTLGGIGIIIPYSNSAFSTTNPFTSTSGVVFDPVTGQISFTSALIQQVIVSVLIKEYDASGNVKGTQLRDIHFIIMNCPPPKFNPYTSGVNYDTLNYSFFGCYNQLVDFEVFSVTFDTAKPIDLQFFSNIPGASFTTRISHDTTYGRFIWMPGSTVLGNYYFSIKTIAKTCPLKRQNIFNYRVNIDTFYNTCLDTTVYLPLTGSIAIDSSYVLDLNTAGACNTSSVTLSKETFSCPDVGVNNVTVTTYYSNGLIKVCNAIVTIIDTVTPYAACMDTIIYLNAAGSFTIDTTFIHDTTVINCSPLSMDLDKYVFNCSDLGLNQVQMIVTDAGGAKDTCQAWLKVKDTISPVAICKNANAYLDINGQVIVDSLILDNGSTDNCGLVNFTIKPSTFDCSNLGPNNAMMIVTDKHGNKDSCQAIITILDTLPPNPVCADTTIYLNHTSSVSITTSIINNGTFDNCTLDSVWLSKYNFDCDDVGIDTIKLFARDSLGYLDSCQAIITIIDTINPIAICQDTVIYVNALGNVSIDSSFINNNLSYGCTISTITLDQYNFDCNNLGINVITMKVMDVNGNTDSCFSNVTVLDTIKPKAICKDTSVYITQSGFANITSSFVNNGSSDNCSLDSIWLSKYVFSCYDIGKDTIGFFVKDSSGNLDSCRAIITIIDTVNPVAICKDTTVYLSAAGLVTIDSSFINNNFAYGCDISRIWLNQYSYDCSHIGPNSITMYVEDFNGNQDSCQAIVTVLDTISPVANCQNVAVYVNTTGSIIIDSSDINNLSIDNCGISSITISQSSFDCSHLGVNTITMIVTDSSGNQDSCQAIVTVLDTINPVANCKDTTIYLNISGTASITNSFVDDGSSDNCSLDSIWLSKYTFNCYDVGIDTISLMVLDSSGNVDSCGAIVTVIDTTNPIAICKDTTIYVTNSSVITIDSSYINNNPSYGCDIATIKLDKYNFDCSNIGANIVSMVVTDQNGNQDSCQAIVTVLDTVSPIANCKDDTVYLSSAGTASIDSSDINNGSIYGCDVSSMKLNKTSFDCSEIGVNLVKLVITDVSGNKDSCQATVTVLDTIKPTPVCQDTTIYINAQGLFTITNSFVENGSFDNCALDSIWLSKYVFDCDDIGVDTIFLYAIDSSGNLDSCQSIITVYDTTNPIAICKDTTIYLSALGSVTIDSSYINNNLNYGCDVETIKLNQYYFDCNNIGVNVITMVVTDANGNQDSCQANVYVLDTLKPIAICRNASIYLNVAGIISIDSSEIDNGSNDNCRIVSMTLSDTSFDCLNLGINTVTLTVLDSIGNKDSCQSTVLVLDTIMPTPICTDTTIYLNNLGVFNITNNFIDNGTFDNCMLDSVWLSKYSFNCSDIGTDTIQLFAKDNSGNLSVCQAIITVLDTLNLTVNAGLDTNICGSSIVQLNGSPIPIGQTGNWSFLSGPTVTTFVGRNTKTPIISGLIKGSYEFIWSITKGTGCIVNRDTIQVNILDSLLAFAGPDIDLCNQNSTNLMGTPVPYGISGIWSPLPGSPTIPTIADSILATTNVSGLIDGKYSFLWTVSNGLCMSVKDTCTVTVNDLTISTAGPDQQLCAIYSANLSGNVPVGRSYGVWRVLNSASATLPVFSDSALPSSGVSGLIEGFYSFEWVVYNGNCPPARDTVNIVVYDLPNADAGLDTILCGFDSLNMYAVQPSGTSTGKWTNITRLPLILEDSSASNSFVKNLGLRTIHTFNWTVSNGVCPSSSDSVQITVLTQPEVEAGVDSGYCDVSSITLNAMPVALPASGSWSVDATTSPNIPAFATPNSPTTFVAGLVEGTYKFVWTVINQPCYTISDTVEISIYNQHYSIVNPDKSLCNESNAIISANVFNGTALGQWVTSATSPNKARYNPILPNQSIDSLISGGEYEMIWEITNGVCPISRDTMTIFNHFNPTTNFVVDKDEICQGDSINFFSLSNIPFPDSLLTERWEIKKSISFGDLISQTFYDPGYYGAELISSSIHGCKDTLILDSLIYVHEKPTAGFSVDNIFNTPRIDINDYSLNASTYRYKFGDGVTLNVPNPFHVYRESGTYTIWQVVTSDFGCVDSVSKDVKIGLVAAFMPNAFTPNGDGTNDVFMPIVSDNLTNNFSFSVYNRWGELIFQTNDINKGWDGSYLGEKCEVGTYVWMLSTNTGEDKAQVDRHGHVNLIR